MRRRKSGNGTSSAQWIYVLWNVPFVWVVKIGIGGKLRKRTRQVGKSAKGWDIPVFAIWIPFAYQVEQFIHRLCSPIRVKFDGTGKTERFLLPAIIPGILIPLLVAVVMYGSVLLTLMAIIQGI